MSATRAATPDRNDSRIRKAGDMVPSSEIRSIHPIPAPTCPLCGAIARRFGRDPGSIMTCTAPDCGQVFEVLVSPRPRVEGGN
jgi:hypothetical protein